MAGFILFTIHGLFYLWVASVMAHKDTTEKFPAEGVILSYMDYDVLSGISSYNVLCTIDGKEVRAQSDSYYGCLEEGTHVKIQYYYKKHAKDIHDIMVEIQDERLKSVSEDSKKYAKSVVIFAMMLFAVAVLLLIKSINY